MQITRTHNGYHLGDNLVHLNFLRKVALANPDRHFVHSAQWQYLKQLREVVSDIPNIGLSDFNYLTPPDSIDSWRGANQFWYQHPNRNDFVNFHIDAWFPYLCERMHVDNPMNSAGDMLFDYPAILERSAYVFPGCDVLVINSPPGSGQFPSYDQYQLGILANQIAANGASVVVTDELPHTLPSTKRLGYSISQIGALSLKCHTILMVSTGPSWPTFNVWNKDTILTRIILLEPERVNLAPNTTHCATVDEAAAVLKRVGLL